MSGRWCELGQNPHTYPAYAPRAYISLFKLDRPASKLHIIFASTCGSCSLACLDTQTNRRHVGANERENGIRLPYDTALLLCCNCLAYNYADLHDLCAMRAGHTVHPAPEPKPIRKGSACNYSCERIRCAFHFSLG